jgi:hypothetical protein
MEAPPKRIMDFLCLLAKTARLAERRACGLRRISGLIAKNQGRNMLRALPLV